MTGGPQQPAAPDFLIAGAARSGTTALAAYLDQHPEIAICRPKEPHYLALRRRGFDFTGPGDDETIGARSIRTIDRYAATIERARSSAPLVGDGSVSALYYWDEVASTLTDELHGEPRVVVVLRDPVDRAYSAYLYLRQRGHEPCPSFGEALALESERVAAGYQPLWHYRAGSRYGAQLDRLIDSVGRDRVGLFIFEELRRDPLRGAAEVARFVGGAPHTFSPVAGLNRSGEPRATVGGAVVSRIRRSEPAVAAARRVVPPTVRSRLVTSQLTYPELDLDLRHRLAADFEADREAVAGYLGRSVPDWTESGP